MFSWRNFSDGMRIRLLGHDVRLLKILMFNINIFNGHTVLLVPLVNRRHMGFCVITEMNPLKYSSLSFFRILYSSRKKNVWSDVTFDRWLANSTLASTWEYAIIK